ncbi:MAG: stage sporulation protein [Euryarchaeota archaeon]|nr:stage sporulation protein [Euryarchaeota archaeon]
MEPMKIKTILPYAAASMVIFLIAGIIGFATGVAYLTAPHTDKVPSVNSAVQTYKHFKEAQVDPLAKQGPLVKAAVISMSNIAIGLSVIVYGYIMARFFGIFFGSLFILSYNGYELGKICFVLSRLTSLKITILSLLPHAIFEFSAVFLCAGAGLFMGYEIMMHRCKDPNYYHNNYTHDEMIESLKFYSKFILPMFILAGFAEVFISPGFI